ncbi:MAG: NUMOD3 domain-containing DNA-binding protein [Clostridia bacterium]
MNYCACGCGKLVNNIYAQGYYIRGKKHSEETKRKISLGNLGKKKKAMFGKDNPNYGNKWTDSMKKSLSKKMKGRGHKQSKETIEKIRKSHLGIKFDDKRKEIISKACIGRIPWNKGKKNIYSEETILKLREAGKLRVGPNSPTWKGGISALPYGFDFNNKLKRKIRKRDNFRCQYPGCRIKNRSLDVHHIDYNKFNNNEMNLIALCKKHHIQSNFNRRFWESFYIDVIILKYTLFALNKNRNIV